MASARRNAEVRSVHAAKQGVSFRADNACAGGANATPVIGDFNSISRKKLVNGATVFLKDAGQIIRNGTPRHGASSEGKRVADGRCLQ